MQVELGNDQSILTGDTIIMQAMVNISIDSISSVTWTGIEPSNCTQCLTQTVVPIITTSYSVEVVSVDGCSDSDEITLFMDHDLDVYVPNIFSPNGDGSNDVFFPRGSGLFRIKSARVFDRWGEVMYEKNDFNANDPNAGWDGSFKGLKLNPDVYIYTFEIICDNNSTLIYKGNIALIK